MKGECIVNKEINLDAHGYPRVKYHKRTQPVSRIIMTLLYGEAAVKGKLICHTCTNKACINPEHLYIGTPQDNSDDKWRDGTMAMGADNGSYRRDVDTSVIVHLYDDMGWKQVEIAEKLGVHQSLVSQRISKHRRTAV